MKTEEQNRAIAEACGWIPENINQRAKFYVPNGDYHVGNPTIDLNAMHEAEKWLKGAPKQYHNDPILHQRWNTYERFLMFECGICGISATAAQRAEAFLRTLNLWTETPADNEDE